MGYVTREQIAAAKEMDLLTYLENYERDELVHVRGRMYATKTHDSLKISNGKWTWWSRGIGGRSALDYLIKVRGFFFTDAVEHILNQMGKKPPVIRKDVPKAEEKPVFTLPQKNDTDRIVRSYLAGRGIDPELIESCIKEGMLYEDRKYHNAVFTGKDEAGEMKYAFYRATNGSGIMGEVSGSDKQFSFRLVEEKSDCLHVFESAIDLLSFMTMAKMDGKAYKGTNYLSLSGVYTAKQDGRYKMPAALDHFLKTNQKIRHICLRLDNDRAGFEAAEQIRLLLKNDYAVYIVPPKMGKDQNDHLRIRKGLIHETKREREERNGR